MSLKLRKSIKNNDIIYFDSLPCVSRKSLMNSTKVEYGDLAINHIEGCPHGCNFPCYAMLWAKRMGKIKNYEEWLHPKIVSNALELLEKEIPKKKNKVDFVHLSFMTDPFPYKHPQIIQFTLTIIEYLNKHNLNVTTLTKGIYPEEILDINKFDINNVYGITLVSLNENFRKKSEPFAAPYEERINSLEKLHKAGLKTWVSIEPYPTPNLDEKATNIEKLLEKIKFVDKLVFGKLNYNIESSKYENNEEFYSSIVKKVIAFCDDNKIEYHIKFGTPFSSEKTSNIFKKKKNDNLLL